MAPALPPFAPFPADPAWRQQIARDQWAAALGSWLALVKAHLSLPDAAFASRSLADESLPPFVAAVVASAAAGPASTDEEAALRQGCFLLAARALRSARPPPRLLHWDFLADVCRAYGRRRAALVLAGLAAPAAVAAAEASLSGLKKQLVQLLQAAGPRRDTHTIEDRLRRVNYLASAWPPAGALLLAGNDFLDALVACFRTMHPPLRRCIVTTTYLCLVGQTEGSGPRWALLSDTLYALRSAAEEHRTGPLGAGDSLVVELVTATPLLQQLQKRIEAAGGASTGRLGPVLKDLAQYRKAHSGLATFVPPRRLARRQADKGKGKQLASGGGGDGGGGSSSNGTADHHALHAHKLSQITQVQDLFPDLGSAFVAKLLDEYNDDPEQVVAHLLEGTLPPHLAAADRTENLTDRGPSTAAHPARAVFTPHATPPLLPRRQNAFDDDDLDTLAADTAAKLHFGKQASARTADDVLRDRAAGPSKATILSALAAFDSDDDERDDTYDAADVGGTVDASAAGADGGGDHDDVVDVDIGGEANEQALFAAYNAAPGAFGQDVQARRSPARARLREATGLADEAIEAWGLMLARSPQAQWRLAATYWDNSTAGRGRGRGRAGGRGGGRGGRGGGNVAGKPHDAGTEEARRRKEAQKSSRANHNRRDQRARKMARGGFPG